MDYITTRQASEKWGVSMRQTQIYLNTGRIKGAKYFGHVWMIPADAEKPPDGRVNNRRQPKKAKPAAEIPVPSSDQGKKNNNGNEGKK